MGDGWAMGENAVARGGSQAGKASSRGSFACAAQWDTRGRDKPRTTYVRSGCSTRRYRCTGPLAQVVRRYKCTYSGSKQA